MRILDLASNNFIVFPSSTPLETLKNELFQTGKEFIIASDEVGVCGVFLCSRLFNEIVNNEKRAVKGKFSDCQSGMTYTLVNQDFPVSDLPNLDCGIALIVNEEKVPLGIVNHVKEMSLLVKQFIKENQETKAVAHEIEKIFESIDDELFVTDNNGHLLRLNPAGERVCGVKACDVIGKHVSELGITTSSITLKVLNEKKKVNMIQETVRSHKKLLSTAVPVFNDDGELIRVVTTSKDVAEINRLEEELIEKNNELERKDKEINLLRNQIFAEVNFISTSKEMNHVKETVTKIASMDLTVLIQGESGAGKEVVAKTIHYLSKRKNQPFVKINCGLIPENLLEAELFGYEGGAFTGANKNGKIGKIELARNGTLFLDEIGEMPLSLQVKLLEFLQDKNFCRVGGTSRIDVDTRVVTATNRDLKQMVKEGSFRQDLFYRLNVIPINVPPLRERKEDISSLTEYFLKRLNNKYSLNKRLAPGVIEAFYYYDWPGNVRELEHVIERLMVISDSNLITIDHFSDVFEVKPKAKRVICYELMPLKLAKRELEEHLVKTAYGTYKSTYKAAKALEIDQSTVVKILKKYKVNDFSSS